MSQRTRVMVTVSIKLPLPAGSAVATFLSHLKGLIQSHFGHEPIIKLEAKETHYL